ncbi:MAG: 3-hydroxybutyryl-CoA dehydrogenase [Halobacteriota archaeon]|nr:3-hydroxybutyryl-CoA dehydrogenase [Halobacteriota archaeon]
MEVRKIAVIGAGLMGSGIAQVAAQSGFEVSIRDVDDLFVENGIASIKRNIKRMVKKEKITEADAEDILGRIRGTTDLKEASEKADVVIEAILENMEIKKELFRELEGICKEETIFASNTSSLSITEMASSTKRPEKFIGMHFFNPAPFMKLVELIRGYKTSDQTLDSIKRLSEQMGKTPIEVNEAAGFAVNRVLVPMMNEAMYAYMEGVASIEDIDTGMKLGANHPMGPFELADFVGLDTLLSVLETMYEEFGDPRYRPCPLLRKMVRSGNLGRKTGRGFYDYTG